MNNSQKSIRRAVVTLSILLILALSGCAGFEAAINMDVDSSGTQPLPAFSNNSTVDLEAETYAASDLGANKVTVIGRGKALTVVSVNWRITGNNATIRSLTVDGDLYLDGNNISLEGVRVTGSVRSSGQNNTW